MTHGLLEYYWRYSLLSTTSRCSGCRHIHQVLRIQC